jgi:preprotein translocase subunit SecA
LRIFASDRVASIMDRLKMPEGEAIEHPWVTRAIENAQRKVEARNFDMRKQLLEYDDVSNDQRKVLYQLRNDLLESDNCYEFIEEIRSEVLDSLVSFHMPPDSTEEQWDVSGLEKTLASEYQLQLPIQEWLDKEPELNEENLSQRVSEVASQQYQNKVDLVGEDIMRQYERAVMLQTLDSHWREHLAALDHLRQGIHLRGYAQKNPKQEYKREAYDLFQAMMEEIKSEVIQILMMVQIRDEKQMEAASEMPQSPVNMQYQHASYEGLGEEGEGEEASSNNSNSNEEAHQPFVRQGGKVGRNDPCPCGSGKKYKQCHGKLS